VAAIAALREVGDRRGTAELLLEAARAEPDPASAQLLVREAHALAHEIGWSEGVSRARRASDPPPTA
jgi:hypothetical protein